MTESGMNNERIEQRKMEHIEICLKEQVVSQHVTTGLEKYRLRHNALPEINFAEIDTATAFLNRRLQVPFLISSMTGGTNAAYEINMRLAETAQRRGWAMGVGSVRAALENADLAYTYAIRKRAPTIPIFANIGAVQLNYGYGVEQCRRAIEMIGADGIVLHLNALQEVFQTKGNCDFGQLLSKIEKLCRALDAPVGVKEVGLGINGDVAVKLREAGVHFIDVAGAGGTSWIQVEKFRSKDAIKKLAAEAFVDWGIPTAECVKEVRDRMPDGTLIASGGINTGVEAAKAMALGADLVGYGRSLLASAVHSAEQLDDLFQKIEFEFRIAMFGVGAAHIEGLKKADHLLYVG